MAVLRYLRAAENYAFAFYREPGVLEACAMHQQHWIGETGPPAWRVDFLNPGHSGW
jgi:hypothetical protein